MPAIPARFPTEVVDRLVAAAKDHGNWFHGLELTFEHRLDADRLARAARLTLDAEPVLGCRWQPHRRTPWWQRLADAERENFDQFSDAGEYEAWKRAGLNIEREPQFKVGLLRGPDADRVLLGLSHAVADGGGIRDAVARCARIYTRLGSEPEHTPVPNTTGSRSSDQIRRRIQVGDGPRIALDLIRQSRGAWCQSFPCLTWALEPEPRGEPAQATAVAWTLAPERTTVLKDWGRALGATLNDILLAAFFRSLASVSAWNGRRFLTATTSADLRRYLPAGKAEAVCNLSSAASVRLGRRLGDTFEDTVRRVVGFTRRLKAARTSLLGPLLWLPLLRHLPFSRMCAMSARYTRAQRRRPGWQPPVFTNAGRIQPDGVRFDRPPGRAYNWPQLLRLPLMQVVVSGYRDAITLTSGVYPSAARERVARALYRAMDAELPV